MTLLVGGLRQRVIRESLFTMLYDSLDALGWFDAGRQHSPINFLSIPVPIEEEVPLNTLVVSDEDATSNDYELGSNASEHRWNFFVDFYAEDPAIGLHLTGDVKDILEGRMVSIGRRAPILTVIDYASATPLPIFTCQIENVDRDRAHNWPHSWLKNWYAVSLTVVDYYGSDDDDGSFGGGSFGTGEFG